MIREYRNGDGLRVAVQRAQLDEADCGAAYFDNVGKYSLVSAAGDVLAVFGYVGQAGDAADCYALIAGDVGGRLIEAVRFLRREIPKVAVRSGFASVRMTVRADFAAGKRFARMLGFLPAEILPDFFNGYDYQLFERILV